MKRSFAVRAGSGLVLSLLWMVAALGLACGDDDASPTDGGAGARDAAVDGGGPPADGDTPSDGEVRSDGGAAISIGDYCARAPGLWCRWLEDCRGLECAEWFGSASMLGALSGTWCADITERVTAGAVAYDPVRAAECIALQEENTRTCAGSRPLHGCHPFSGVTQPGGDCYIPFPVGECDDQRGRCTAARFEERCPGTCQAYAALGTPCVDGAAICAPDAYCDDTTGCTTRPGEGEACQGQCATELTCVTIAPGGDRCVRLGTPGDPCAADQPCDSESTCIAGTCVDSVARGEACESSGQCADTDYCLSNVCTILPAVAEPCDQSGRCGDGACGPDVGGQSVCQPMAGDGDLCDPGMCESGLWCKHGATENRCLPRGGAGADCSGERAWIQIRRCTADLFCSSDGTCSSFLPAGAACDPDRADPQCDRGAGVWCDAQISQCLAPPTTQGARCIGACSDGLWCNSGVCEPQSALGEACINSEACPLGASCNAFSDDPTKRCRAVSACNGP